MERIRKIFSHISFHWKNHMFFSWLCTSVREFFIFINDVITFQSLHFHYIQLQFFLILSRVTKKNTFSTSSRCGSLRYFPSTIHTTIHIAQLCSVSHFVRSVKNAVREPVRVRKYKK